MKYSVDIYKRYRNSKYQKASKYIYTKYHVASESMMPFEKLKKETFKRAIFLLKILRKYFFPRC
jgi:hypothetical protein